MLNINENANLSLHQEKYQITKENWKKEIKNIYIYRYKSWKKNKKQALLMFLESQIGESSFT